MCMCAEVSSKTNSSIHTAVHSTYISLEGYLYVPSSPKICRQSSPNNLPNVSLEHSKRKWKTKLPFPNLYGIGKLWLTIKTAVNDVVSNESKLTVATCNWTRAIHQIQTTPDGVNGGTLPCVWLAHATSVCFWRFALRACQSWMKGYTIGREIKKRSVKSHMNSLHTGNHILMPTGN